MVRGIERTAIFRDERDRDDFLTRLAACVASGALTVYAWALLPNHLHLLVRTGTRPLARSMRSLLTGYAGAFNRRHRRIGHLFQNRYKSIVVEEEPYLLELVRYLHLNPLRAKRLPDLPALDQDPWTGHSALLGTVSRPWQDTQTILAQFGPTPRRARAAYRRFIGEGIAQGRRPDLQGGGLVRSLGGWAAVATLRRGREAYRGDERILGSSEFVEAVCRDTPTQPDRAPADRPPLLDLLARVCAATGCPPAALQYGSRRRLGVQAREGVAYLAVACFGYTGGAVAELLRVQPPAVYRAAERGRANRARWDELLGSEKRFKNSWKQRP